MSDADAGAFLSVSETFYSMQGEGLAVGRPCFFIRLAGCNLRCRWCDTSYAWRGGSDVHVASLMKLWRQSGVSLVQITGGEPLLQSPVIQLMNALLAEGAEVLLETNGSLDISSVPQDVTMVVDRKTPSSGMAGWWLDSNVRWMRSGDQLKFVIGSRCDYRWACGEMKRLNLHSDVTVLFSPVSGSISSEELAQWVLNDRLAVRFQIQLHRLLWGKGRGF